MKRKTTLTLTLLCLFRFSSQSQIMNYLAEINATVATIPYIFEGQIQSVEIFAGDDHGNKLPWSAAVWTGDVGYFYDEAGKEAYGYSLAKIQICKIYKGDLNPEMQIEVLTKSFTLGNVYLYKSPDGDTSLRYMNVQPTHAEGEYSFILPHVSYPKKIYFCDRIDEIQPNNYTGANFYSNFHSLLEMPFNQPVYVPQLDGTTKYMTAYCALIPYGFETAVELQAFLNQINTIDPDPVDYCRIDRQVLNINEVGENPFNISVYPNPSTIDESVKIRFDLNEEHNVTIVLTDITGKLVVNASIGTLKNVDYDLKAKIGEGVYFLQVTFGKNSQRFKISKN